jgi:catechol 2,3-dioxygenase-like lactoylglutathione lyase family enzyme
VSIEFPEPKEGFVLTHFVVSADVRRAAHFYSEVLGGELVRDGEPSIVALASGWVIINEGGGPTADKPSVTLGPPGEPGYVSGFGYRSRLRAVVCARRGLLDAAD